MIITAAPELLHLSPNDIDIDINVRLDPRLDREFLSSIEEHGVLVPVLAVRFDGQCKPRVREGQRRIQAARQVGLASVPVYIRTVEGTDADLRAQRIIEQIVTNDQRAPLTAAERARGIHQLLLEGVSPTKVAKGLSTTKTTVAAAQAAIDSERAMSALDTGQLSLIEAASFVEFDGDDDAQTALIKVAGTDQFDHRVAQLRADREDRRRRQEAAAPFAAQGYTVLDRRPSWSDTDHVDTNYLRDATGAALTDEAIAAMDPRHWAVVLVDTESFRDAETGEPVDERDIDFDTADDPTLEPADGLRHARTITQTTEWSVEQRSAADVSAGSCRGSEIEEGEVGAADTGGVQGGPDEGSDRTGVGAGGGRSALLAVRCGDRVGVAVGGAAVGVGQAAHGGADVDAFAGAHRAVGGVGRSRGQQCQQGGADGCGS